MFMPDYLSTPTTQLRHQAITTWQHWQPRLQAVGAAAIGMMVIAIAATIEAGRQARDAWEWLYPRLKAAYRAFCEYQEPSPAPVPIRFEDEESVILPSLEEFAATLLALEQEEEEETVLQEPAAPATATAPTKRRGRPRKVEL